MSAESGPGDERAPGLAAPRRILVAGDWHGDEDWALSVIRRAQSTLARESPRLILQLGDFGVWPDRAGQDYLARVSKALAEVEAELWFIDGNHEDFPQLARLASDTTPDGRVVVRPGLFHLPRGYHWTWHGLRWLACGGGVSLDRAGRTEGVDWWPAEEITDAQEAAISSGGHADVLVSHDCPSGVAHTFGRPPSWWDPVDLARNDAHRRRLQRIVDAVQPSRIMHGHLHRAYQRSCDFGYGPVQVTGLDADNRLRNFAVFNVADMSWELREGWFSRVRRGPVAGLSGQAARGGPVG
jgi:Calcineurin-like phosphoesterase